MKNDFLRQLTIPIPEAEGKKLFLLLSASGMEVFGKRDGMDEYRNLVSFSDAEAGILYVSAADRAEAAKIMTEAGLSSYISENVNVASEKESYVEQAEKEYDRKRKITMYEALVVILAVLFLYFVKFF